MKKIISLAAFIIFAITIFAFPAAAYKPGYEQFEDIRWFGGYDPASGLSVMKDVENGVRCYFKHDPTRMWANRVVAGWDYNLSDNDSLKAGVTPDKEGIYVHLEDIKWDLPKPTPSLPNPEPSICISITATQGGWSDGRALMFWIIRGRDDTYRMAVLRGMDADEKNVDQFAMDYTVFKEPIKDEIHFYFRRTSNDVWTLNINNNVFTFDDKTIVRERFKSLNPVAVSLGTWDSGGPVEYTVSELWGYGVIEYGKKVDGKYVVNPAPAFVQAVRKVANTTTTTNITRNNNTSGNKQNTPGTTVQNPAGGSDSTTQAVTDETTSADPDVTQNDTDTQDTDATTQNNDQTDTDTDTENKGGNALIWVIIALIVVVLVGGGVTFYFMFIKNNNNRSNA